MKVKELLARHGDLAAALVIAVTGFIIYANSYNVPWYFDDYGNITENRSVFNSSNPLKTILAPRGPAILTFSLNYALHGISLPGYHLFNNLIHIMVTLVVYLLLKRVVSGGRSWALIGALLFLAHPLQTQAVTYIVQRMTSLSALFAFLCLYCYVRGREALADGTKTISACHALWYVSMLVACALAVATKQNTAFLPLGLYIFGRYFLDEEQGWSRKQSAVYLAPFVIPPLVISYSVLLAPVLRGVPLYQLASAGEASPLYYFVTEWQVLWIYLRLLFLPYGQILVYNYPLVSQLVSPLTVCAGSGILLLLFAAYRLKDTIPPVSFAISWLFVSLAVESTFIPLDTVFEHRLYIPMFGFVILLMWLSGRISPASARLTVSMVVIVLFSFLTWQRNALWANPIAFNEDNLRKTPGNERIYIELSRLYIEEKRYGEAEKLLVTALASNPRSGKIYDNLGSLYDIRGEKEQAIEIYKKGLAADPRYQKLYLNLAVVFESLNKFDLAEGLLRQALRIMPNMASAHYNLGVVLYRMGRLPEARESFRAALDNAPYNQDALYNLAIVEFETGNKQRALDAQARLRLLAPLRANALDIEFAAAGR